MKIKFSKMTGSGNDFILIDLFNQQLPEDDLPNFAKKLCHRSLSLGADGLILIEKSDIADFKWRFYNSDGSEAEMCGNGARCAARFAYMNGIAGKKMAFETVAGIISAEILDNEVKVALTSPKDMKRNITIDLEDITIDADFINTGVPHTVVFVNELEECRIEEIGRKIRFHKLFEPAGTNVNFVEEMSSDSIKIRTYERGVEGETLACGTGAVASAIFQFLKGGEVSPVKVLVRSGEKLKVYISKNNSKIDKVFLQGTTRLICEGTLDKEAWDYN
ncbi:MAG: diaminopimelate epimerase [Candidatus Schekmanbacteria bacterium]|nr:MAG: diaminopimelate epimerase [Candidatus Schekmanbacteria bacterium]